jgi:hypothetical protein
MQQQQQRQQRAAAAVAVAALTAMYFGSSYPAVSQHSRSATQCLQQDRIAFVLATEGCTC